MSRPAQLTRLQLDLAELSSSLDEAGDFLVAGGAALVASSLISRSTEDLGLFAVAPTTSVAGARDAFICLLHGRGCAGTPGRSVERLPRHVFGRRSTCVSYWVREKWPDHNIKFHRYEGLESTPTIDRLLAEIDADPLCVF